MDKLIDCTPTPIEGVFIVKNRRITDLRGSFARLYCEQELSEILDGRYIIQINQSITHKIGAIRGMHLQHAPDAEMKLIRCLRGRVWDVAVDLRKSSPTFLQWHGTELSGDDNKMIVIPEGCAHGFQVLQPDSELLYLHTAPYNPKAEAGVRFNDDAIAINWPLPERDISERDLNHPLIDSEFSGAVL